MGEFGAIKGYRFKYKQINKYAIIAFFISIIFASCGIDDYMYLEPVPPSNITVTSVSSAVINLPTVDTSRFYYFRRFVIYYRIYISATYFSPITPDKYILLNPALNSDYNAFLPYTDSSSTTVNTSDLGTLFRNRNYWTLLLESADIENVLAINGTSVILDFSQIPGVKPLMTIGTNSHNLFRSNGGGSFSPVPDRYFRDNPDLKASGNATAFINADVAASSDLAEHAYVAFYIAAFGIDDNFSPIYSTPTFIAVLRLP